MRSYAYFVWSNGKKRFGGVCHANSMDEAASLAARLCKLEVWMPKDDYEEPQIRLPNGGDRVDLAVWATAREVSRG